MTLTDFSTTLLVDQTPKEVFQAINNVRGWWSEEIEGGTHKLNDEFTYHYKDLHRCKMKLIEVVPEKKVVWQVLDNYFSFTKDRSEWKGTTIHFEIIPKDGKTQLRFTHEGLVPEYECFDICSNAWTDYIQNSLGQLIATGKGKPNKDEQDYQKIITVKKPVREVYAAITEQISEWWSRDFTGASSHLGDQFNIAFGGTRKTFEIIEAIPDEFVAWKCLKAYIDMASLKNKSEWVDTKVLWTFSVSNKETTINFMHQGLHKSLECYEVCEAGWDQFLGSLETFLKTGKGKPYSSSRN
jgi:uncharacterized protein YndB with AHSA1/START domain